MKNSASKASWVVAAALAITGTLYAAFSDDQQAELKTEPRALTAWEHGWLSGDPQ